MIAIIRAHTLTIVGAHGEQKPNPKNNNNTPVADRISVGEKASMKYPTTRAINKQTSTYHNILQQSR